jgi:ribokinase
MITVAGSLLMDLAIQVPSLVRPGGVVHGHHLRVACGGKGANQACAVARLGGKAALIGVVGADLFGEAMISALRDCGVDTRAVSRRHDGASGCFVVAADPHGETEIIVANGINGALSAADVEQHSGLIASSQALIVQLETTFEAVEAALRIARQAGVLTILNAAPAFQFRTGLLSLCDIAIVNEHEAAIIAGCKVTDPGTVGSAASEIRRQGAHNALITMAAAGVWADFSDWQGHIPSYPVHAVDTLGAGDTFTGAFVTRLCEGAEMRAAAEFATAAAALSVTRPGAQPSIPYRGEVEAFIAAGKTL